MNIKLASVPKLTAMIVLQINRRNGILNAATHPLPLQNLYEHFDSNTTCVHCNTCLYGGEVSTSMVSQVPRSGVLAEILSGESHIRNVWEKKTDC